MKRVIWGVLSTAKIGMQRVIPGMQKSDWCDIAQSRRALPTSSRAAADALGIPKAYGSYEELLADPKSEAVYNPSPPPARAADYQGGPRRQARPLREADCADRGGATPACGGGQGAHHGSFMVRFHPNGLRAAIWSVRATWNATRGGRIFFSYFNATLATSQHAG